MQYLPDNLVLPYDLEANVLSDATVDLIKYVPFRNCRMNRIYVKSLSRC
jgi:hypothetical protein